MFRRLLLAASASIMFMEASALEPSDNIFFDLIAEGICYRITDDYNYNVEVRGTSVREDYSFDTTKVFHIHIPSSVTIKSKTYKVTAIGNNAFRNCMNIDSIIVPPTVETIGTSAFSSCSNLKAVILPNSVVEIADHAFSGCVAIDSITLPENLKSLGFSAFDACRGLTHLTLPASLAEVGPSVFRGCSRLQTIDVDNNNQEMVSADGVLYNKNRTTLISIPEGRTLALMIPPTVTLIKCPFTRSSKLACISCPSVTPPAIAAELNYQLSLSLFVPKRALEAYRQHAYWSHFNIHSF